MEHVIIAAPHFETLERIYIITATLKTFKGRRNVDVHLFRANPDSAELETLRAMNLVGKPDNETPVGCATPEAGEDALRTVLEAFTAEEGNDLLEYLDKRYAEQFAKVVVCPLELPVPLGVVPLSTIPEGKTMGFIHLNAVRDYPLPFQVHGFYDLDAHEPLLPE
ncbi:MAG: hypothetical protein RRY29_10455 [Desulfovibrionaceae bacterium]